MARGETPAQLGLVETLFVGGVGATMARPKASCSISLNEPYEAEAGDILFAYGSA